jgi:hypothetical protein
MEEVVRIVKGSNTFGCIGLRVVGKMCYMVKMIEGYIDEEINIVCDQRNEMFGSAFYCQSQIEDNGKCDVQCNHCQEYYKPLEQ